MFDRTTAFFKQTADDVKRMSTWMNIISQMIYITYLCYAVFTGARYLPLNIVLLALSTIYFVLHIIFCIKGESASKKVKKRVRDGFLASRRLIQLVIVSTSLITIYRDQVNVVTIPVLFSIVSALTFVLNVIIDVLSRLISAKFAELGVLIKADFNDVMDTKIGKLVNFGINLATKKKKKSINDEEKTE